MFSEDYRKQQIELHKTGAYGNLGDRYTGLILKLYTAFNCKEILDYGCGSKQLLKHDLPGQVKYIGYDIIPEFYHDPEPADFVVCIDTLEHIEPEYLEDVLDHLSELTKKVFFATVHTMPAVKTLPDGRNAHLTQKEMEWWFQLFAERWNVQSAAKISDREFHIIALRRENAAVKDSGKVCS